MAHPPHCVSFRVYYEDTDLSGFVYHANYLKFLERGRSEFLRTLGLDHETLRAAGQVFAVRQMELDFLSPARIDDVLEVATRVASVSGARFVLEQTISLDGRVLISAHVVVVFMSVAGRPLRLPDVLRQSFTE